MHHWQGRATEAVAFPFSLKQESSMGATIAGPRSKSSSKEGRAGEAERSGLLNPGACLL